MSHQQASECSDVVAPRPIVVPRRVASYRITFTEDDAVSQVYRELCNGYAAGLCRSLAGRAVSDAEVADFLSFVGVRLGRRLGAYRRAGSFDGFVRRVMTRLFFDWRRLEGRHTRIANEARATVPAQLTLPFPRSRRQQVRAVLAGLSLEYRLALVLPELCELVTGDDLQALARRHGCDVATVEQKLARAIRADDDTLALARLVFTGSEHTPIDEGTLVNRLHQARSRAAKKLGPLLTP